MKMLKNFWAWIVLRKHEFFMGVFSGIVSSLLFAGLVKTTELKEWFFDLPKEPKCTASKIPSDNMFVYNWEVTVDVKNASKFLLYGQSDFFIRKESLAKNLLVYHVGKINEFPSGDYLGFIAHFEKPKDGMMNFSFTTESMKPLETSSCQNFLLSL